jgi:hypothetical protein
VVKLFGVWGVDVYREEGMLSPGRKPGESSDLMGVPPWSLVAFRLGWGIFCQGGEAVVFGNGNFG